MNTQAVMNRNLTVRGGQRGAILVTSLLLLLILTILGIGMMRLTNMQERMASNTRDLNLALQGSEAAMRQAERKILAQWIARPVSPGVAGCEPCQREALPVAMWDPSQFNWANAQPIVGTLTPLAAAPRYAVEELAFLPDDLGVAGLQPITSGRDVYQITTRSTGASGLVNTVLQGTYTKRY